MLTPMNDDESCAPWTVTTAVAVMAEPNRCYQWPVLGVIGFSMQPRMLPSSAETVVLVFDIIVAVHIQFRTSITSPMFYVEQKRADNNVDRWRREDGIELTHNKTMKHTK